jgi:hypothetical protein
VRRPARFEPETAPDEAAGPAAGEPAGRRTRLLTTEEVAARFRTGPATVRYWRHIGIGPTGVKVGRRVLYAEAECDRWWETKVAASLNGTH